ncbi:ABC transporter permease [Haladaptatus sp. CMAA 1911]|uniref:ABC transporter permease n=1 Tax=unclassified Haladaptatus TaxID=2622732 RepID=UPI003753ECC4
MNHSDQNSSNIDENPFETVAEVNEVSRNERYKSLLNDWVLTPLRIAWSDRRTRIGGLIVFTYVLMGTVGVVVLKPPETGYPILVPPFTDPYYILGTNGLGQPILRSIVYATPAMLKMITAGAVFSTILATGVGVVSGYKGGRTDRILTTITDVMLTIPGLPLIIVVSAIFQPKSPLVIGVLLTINSWAGLARSIRSQVLTIRNQSYVEASRKMGMSTPMILRRDILPNIMPFIMINFVGAARYVIFASVGLYFLGILPFTTLNWGVMMNLAYEGTGALYSLSSAHTIILPMVAIVILSYGLTLIAQGSDRLFNPRVRARHMGMSRTTEKGDEDQNRSTSIDMMG